MASPTQNFTPRLYHGAGEPLSPATALAAYALSVVTMYGVALLIGGGRIEIALAQLVGLGLVPLALARVHELDRAHLGLVRPSVGAVLGAAVCGAGLWLVALHLAAPVVELTRRHDEVRAWSQTVFAGRPSVAVVIVTVVVVPSLCEELAHRGLLAGGLAPKLGRALAIAISVMVFALLHLEPARMVATALLGTVAGVLAAWSRSLWPAVVLHAVNNLIVALLGLGKLPALARAIDRDVTATVATAIALVAIGIAISARAAFGTRGVRASGTVRP